MQCVKLKHISGDKELKDATVQSPDGTRYTVQLFKWRAAMYGAVIHRCGAGSKYAMREYHPTWEAALNALNARLARIGIRVEL